RISERAFMDIAIGTKAPRRIVFKLFPRKCPSAVKNFIELCSGNVSTDTYESGNRDKLISESALPQLTYKNSTFHRVEKGYLIQGGDIVTGRGTEQLSIYGGTFSAPEEVRASVFDKPGLVGTASSSPNAHGSQFFILTAKEANHLNGTCICFGQVADGLDVVQEIEQVPIDPSGFPSLKVSIVDCGVLE
nr:Chain BZ, Peptidyl-prolyl cis-trans isomerase [Trypanosoma brucei]